ncbi:penicillin-binding transpeptidase domain-containing protein [Methylocella sp.]|jgi:penicillin-binding protein 1C|uniref:penicillin-binding transpeptidase domain-containing protein n=1 Tax=Methylocella sp. TaxID=1978226 RepID=UPI003C1892D7
MVVERGTGVVLADLGSSDYAGGHAGALDFTQAERSPGSTLKPFIYALALDRGVIRPSDILPDLPEGAS